MPTECFRPEILLSPVSLARFFNGAEETAAILGTRQSSSSSRLADRWDVLCLSELLELYHFTAYFILMITSYVLDGLCMPDISKRVWVLSCHELSDATTLKTQKVFQEHFLARAINAHRKDTSDFYLQQNMRLSLPGQSEASHLQFFHSNGLCRGMSHWFVYLYFKTLGHFTDPQEHIQAVGRQFEQGASRQASFLQSMKPLSAIYDLLQLHMQGNYANVSPRGKTHEQIIQEIQCLAPSIYGLYVGNHQLIYIKTHNNHQFLFDSNKGVLKVDSQDLFKKAMSRYLNEHDDSQEILIDRYSPRYTIP